MRAPRFRIILAAFVLLAIVGVLLPGGNSGIRPHLPRLGHVPAKPKALERQVKAAQEKAVDQCPLTKAEAKERSGNGTAPLDHDAGDCTPGPSPVTPPKVPFVNKSHVFRVGTSYGIDLSNNDPIYGDAAWRSIHAAGVSYAWLKLREGTSFEDATAAAMATYARRNGVAVGGYLFSHVCLVSPDSEADLFIARLRTLRMDTPDSLRPALDTEYGGCSTRAGGTAFIARENARIVDALHVRTAAYSYTPWLDAHTDCLFAHLPKDTLPWIAGYPNAANPCGAQIVVHQYTDCRTLIGRCRDGNRVERGSPSDLLAGGHQAPKEAVHQCKMHAYYVPRFRRFSKRQLERHAEKPPRELDAYGAARLKSATDHLYVIRHYFVKNHEHGRANYDCHPDGSVTVRNVKQSMTRTQSSTKPTRKPKPAHTSVSAPFRIVGGRAPAPSLIAPYIDIVTDGATVNSVYRGADAAGILHSCGLHTQGEVFAISPPGVANPPGFSTHELRSDGVAYPVPRGEKLEDWQEGVDVNDADIPKVFAHARKLGWQVFQPYPGSSVEFHHWDFLVRPAPNEHVSKDKIRARRERLPTHC